MQLSWSLTQDTILNQSLPWLWSSFVRDEAQGHTSSCVHDPRSLVPVELPVSSNVRSSYFFTSLYSMQSAVNSGHILVYFEQDICIRVDWVMVWSGRCSSRSFLHLQRSDGSVLSSVHQWSQWQGLNMWFVFSRLGSESRSFSLFHVVVLEKCDKHISETFVMLGHNNKILFSDL